MDMYEIKQRLLKGEKADLECKEAKNTIPKSIYESYSALANTKGGDIILGISEDRSQIDLKDRFIL